MPFFGYMAKNIVFFVMLGGRALYTRRFMALRVMALAATFLETTTEIRASWPVFRMILAENREEDRLFP